MIKVFISQPTDGLTDEQISKTRAEACRNIRKKMGRHVYFIDSEIKGGVPVKVKNKPLWYLGTLIKMLAKADVAYFVDGWAGTDECIIEHMACKLYGIDIIKD